MSPALIESTSTRSSPRVTHICTPRSLDEPTTFLDISHQLEVMELLQQLNAENDLSIVMVLHDLNQAARFSHRMVALRDGAIYASGAPDAVMTGEVLREVFRVEGVIARDPHTGTPVFTPLQSVRTNGSGHLAEGAGEPR